MSYEVLNYVIAIIKKYINKCRRYNQRIGKLRNNAYYYKIIENLITYCFSLIYNLEDININTIDDIYAPNTKMNDYNPSSKDIILFFKLKSNFFNKINNFIF